MQSPKKFTNRLINETSPYLLQHAHNPVDWYGWGDEAFEKARAEDKPVLVSIGYSACHWCHVMEHESFEDEATASLMNEHFVNIKVDMEERPDVDQIYMNFVQLTTGRGGWPMNVFVTPEKLPFFGGTYFPPDPRYGMPSWKQIVSSIADAWVERREELMESASGILSELKKLTFVGGSEVAINEDLLDSAFRSFERSFDARNGGWGGAPKFPQAMSMEFLLRYWKRTGNQKALEMVEFTARKMANGGIYDQLGDGFHRYAVDAVWLVPHFEKMLYDNAQLAKVYTHLYQITKDEFYSEKALGILNYAEREMLDEMGGFYSSQDADSEGEEGKFFVWDKSEILEVLGSEDAAFFCDIYSVSEEGNFEEKNILNIGDGGSVATLPALSDEERSRLRQMKARLFEHREQRIKPFRDEKVLTAWNGLMLSAFAKAAAAFDNSDLLNTAKRNADFILEELLVRPEDAGTQRLLLRSWKDGTAKLNGYLEDYANLADGLIELYQASGEVRYLKTAKDLADLMITEFWDAEEGGFFFTANDHEELIVRNKDFYDNATPSGNSVAADVLIKLSKYFGEERYFRFASTVLRLASGSIGRHPQGFGRALSTAEFYVSPIKEVVIVGKGPSALVRTIFDKYLPNMVVAISDEEGASIPLSEGKGSTDGKSMAYVCENFVCDRPVSSPEDLEQLLNG